MSNCSKCGVKIGFLPGMCSSCKNLSKSLNIARKMDEQKDKETANYKKEFSLLTLNRDEFENKISIKSTT